jgi:hypothetical protein
LQPKLLDQAPADGRIDGSPNEAKMDLVQEKIIPQATYDKIAKLAVVKHAN